MKPLQAPDVGDKSVSAWAYPFHYIAPMAHVKAMKKLYPIGEASDIPNTGPAPFLMRVRVGLLGRADRPPPVRARGWASAHHLHMPRGPPSHTHPECTRAPLPPSSPPTLNASQPHAHPPTRPPTLQREDWVAVTPRWEHYAAVIEGDEGLRKELGWVREMYGFSAALAELKLVAKMTMEPPDQSKLIAQLPIDHSLANAHSFHYTQVCVCVCVGGWGGGAGRRAPCATSRACTAARHHAERWTGAPPPTSTHPPTPPTHPSRRASAPSTRARTTTPTCGSTTSAS